MRRGGGIKTGNWIGDREENREAAGWRDGEGVSTYVLQNNQSMPETCHQRKHAVNYHISEVHVNASSPIIR